MAVQLMDCFALDVHDVPEAHGMLYELIGALQSHLLSELSSMLQCVSGRAGFSALYNSAMPTLYSKLVQLVHQELVPQLQPKASKFLEQRFAKMEVWVEGPGRDAAARRIAQAVLGAFSISRTKLGSIRRAVEFETLELQQQQRWQQQQQQQAGPGVQQALARLLATVTAVALQKPALQCAVDEGHLPAAEQQVAEMLLREPLVDRLLQVVKVGDVKAVVIDGKH
jgi:hypothetical protein